MMIRLMVILGAGLFLTLLIAGQDKGQIRDGLRMASVVENAPKQVAMADPVVVTPRDEPATEVVFVPAQPVALVAEPVAEPAPVVAAPQPPAAAKDEAVLRYVGARSANVRGGPSTSDPILGNLKNGEAVLVVLEDTPVRGWSRVRIEGDGLEGYVASRLLTDAEPASN